MWTLNNVNGGFLVNHRPGPSPENIQCKSSVTMETWCKQGVISQNAATDEPYIDGGTSTGGMNFSRINVLENTAD